MGPLDELLVPCEEDAVFCGEEDIVIVPVVTEDGVVAEEPEPPG